MQKNRKGFTLIELIIAMLVMAIGIMGVMQVFPVGLRNTIKAQHYTKCVEYAEKKMEELRTIGYDALDSYLTGSDTPENGYLVIWTVTPDGTPYTGVRKVRVDAYYSSILNAGIPDTTRSSVHITLDSYIAKVYW